MNTYRAEDVCKILGITNWTLTKWYQWERKALESGEITERELPIPDRIESMLGRPRIWTSSQIAELLHFQLHIVRGRNGRMGKVTNPKSRQAKHKH